MAYIDVSLGVLDGDNVELESKPYSETRVECVKFYLCKDLTVVVLLKALRQRPEKIQKRILGRSV